MEPWLKIVLHLFFVHHCVCRYFCPHRLLQEETDHLLACWSHTDRGLHLRSLFRKTRTCSARWLYRDFSTVKRYTYILYKNTTSQSSSATFLSQWNTSSLRVCWSNSVIKLQQLQGHVAVNTADYPQQGRWGRPVCCFHDAGRVRYTNCSKALPVQDQCPVLSFNRYL